MSIDQAKSNIEECSNRNPKNCWGGLTTFFLISSWILPFSPSVHADVHRNLAYGTHKESQSLDIYLPDKNPSKTSSSGLAQTSPIMIWVHGGAWRMGDKRGVNHKPIAFNAHGFLFVSINYRLTPEITIPEQAADVAQAVAWVRHHAVEYGGSPDAIFLMGHSAGAHLVALTAINPSYLQKEGMNPSYLKGVILLDGAAYDVPHQIASARLPRLKQMYLTAFSNDEEKQRLASPIFHVSPNNSIPPFLILHVADRLDGKLQSNALGEKLRAAGVQAEVIPAEGKSHLTINRELGISDDKPTEEVFRFLESRLQKLEKKPE